MLRILLRNESMKDETHRMAAVYALLSRFRPLPIKATPVAISHAIQDIGYKEHASPSVFVQSFERFEKLNLAETSKRAQRSVSQDLESLTWHCSNLCKALCPGL